MDFDDEFDELVQAEIGQEEENQEFYDEEEFDDEQEQEFDDEEDEDEEQFEEEEVYINNEEIGSESSSNKRVKIMPNRDRLSALSDSFLIQILSLLGMQEAVRTCVLSKRWRFLWTDFPIFELRDFSTQIDKIRKFVSWITRTLVLCTHDYLKNFDVNFKYDKCFASDVNVWIEFAVKFRVKKVALRLDSCSKDSYILPQIMYSNSSLEILILRKCVITPRGNIYWSSLKFLYLENVELHQPVIAQILSGCPVLYLLHLNACSGIDRLEVNSQRLTSLTVIDYESFLEISAPYLNYLEISPYSKQRFRLKNISSLLKASIDFDNDLDAMYYVQNLFLSLQHVKNLELGPRSFKVLSALLRKGLWIPIPKQDCLRLKLWMDELSLSLILPLLGSFPDLETLVIERTYLPYQASVGRGSYASYLLKCDLMHLKSVDIKNFEESNIAGEPILKLVQLLLDKAMVLEKMVIKVNDLRGLSSTHNSSDYIKIARTLLSYPRSSPKAVVVLR